MRSPARYIALSLIPLSLAALLFCNKKPTSPDKQRDELAPKGSIGGVVLTSTNRPLIGAVVGTDTAGYTTVTDSLGRFTLPGVLEGEYTLRFTRYGYCDTSIAGVVVKTDEDVVLPNDICMRSAFCVIEGTVVAGAAKAVHGHGTGVRGAGVAVPGQSVSTIADNDGTFRLTGVSPEATKLVAALGVQGWGEKEIQLQAGDVLSDVSIALNLTGGVVTGRVVDDAGAPVAGIAVQTVGGGIVDTTDSLGEYRLVNVPNDIEVAIVAEGGRRLTGLVLKENAVLDGIDLAPQTDLKHDSVMLNSSSYLVPDSATSVRISADVSYDTTSGAEMIASVLWDTDNDGEYDTATSTHSLDIDVNAQEQTVGYGVITTSGDTVGMAYIPVRRAAPKPEIQLDSSVTVAPGELAKLKGDVICQSGGILLYQWDFDGDGVYDWKRTDNGTVSYPYYQEGTYEACFLVVTENGFRDSATMKVVVQGKEQEQTTARAYPPKLISVKSADTVSTEFKLVWESSDADSYTVVIDTVSPPSKIDSSGIIDTQYTVTGLTSGTTYYCQVQAYANNDTASTFSVTLHAADAAANTPPVLDTSLYSPASPATITGNDSVTLSWNASDADSDTLLYAIYFGLATSPTLYKEQLVDTELAVMPDGGWRDSATYYWQIEVSDGTDTVQGAVRSFTHLVPADSTPPSAPTGLQAQAASESRIDLTWEAASDSQSGISLYYIYRDGTKVAQTSTTSYSDSGLSASSDHVYTVKAVNGEGTEGPPSAGVTGTTLGSGGGSVAILEPARGSQLQMDSTVELIGTGTNLTWSYDANSDGLGIQTIGSGNNILFRVPTGVTGEKVLILILSGDEGTDTVTYSLTEGSEGTAAPQITAGPSDTSVAAGDTVIFRITATGDSLQYQWLRNDTILPGETSSEYKLVAAETDSGAQLTCNVSNSGGSVTSSAATLSVTSSTVSDNTPPTFDSASARGSATAVLLSFSEPLEKTSAESAISYSIDNGISVAAAELLEDSQHVLLSTSAMDSGGLYTVTVSGIADLAGNTMSTAANQPFSYQPGIQVLYPNGGETLTVGNSATCRWTASSSVGSVILEITFNEGMSWHRLTTEQSIARTDGSWGAYQWTIPAQLGGSSTVSDQCRFRVSAYISSESDQSDTPFSIVSP